MRDDNETSQADKKPRVLIVGKLPPPYFGPAVATKTLLDSSLNDHFELLHVNTNVHTHLETLGEWGWWKISKNVGIYAAYWRTLRQEKPVLVLKPISQATMGFLKDSPFVLLAALAGVKVLVQLRGSNFKTWLRGTSPWVRKYVAWVLSYACGVIVLGTKLRYLFADHFSEDQIFVAPNGADYDMPPAVEKKAGAPLRVLYFANLLPTKGVKDLLTALVGMDQYVNTPFSVDICGVWSDQAYRDECLSIVDEHQLPVTFHGQVTGSDKLEFFSQADCFVFVPRAPEGHPWVIVEALAAGLPIISTDQGAITESVLDGVNGYVVGSANPDHLRERLSRLIDDQETRQQFALASRRIYLDGFTEAQMVARYHRIFSTLVAG